MSETHFPLDESKLPFSIPKDAQPREKILKLGRMITDRIPAKLHGLTAEDPEYWGLAGVVTDEMADVALKMKVRKPMTLSELVKATGKACWSTTGKTNGMKSSTFCRCSYPAARNFSICTSSRSRTIPR